MLDYSIENELTEAGYEIVCGIDEAGRGPLCGPVVAAACILPRGLVIDGLNDSKKLTEKKREKVFEEITKNALAYSIALSTVEEINETNILEATLLAMRRAVEQLQVRPDFALVDGNRDPGIPDVETLCIVKGDAQSASIAAASILAKVTRDRLMMELDAQYPQYQFAKHKGYPTALHQQLVLEHGPCPQHRQTFLKKIYARAGK